MDNVISDSECKGLFFLSFPAVSGKLRGIIMLKEPAFW